MFSLLFLMFFVVKMVLSSAFAFSAAFSRQPAKIALHNLRAADMIELPAALSGCSRTICLPLVSIQRLAPEHPPAISAEILQNLQLL